MNHSWRRLSLVLQIFAGAWVAFVGITILYMLGASLISDYQLEAGFLGGCLFYLALGALTFWAAKALGRQPSTD